MACSQVLNGIPRDCNSNVGGIKRILIANADDVASVTYDSTGAKISGITMAGSAKFAEFAFKKGQASAVYTSQFNEAGEYAGEDGVITVNFGRMDTTKRAQMHALSTGEFVVVYEDANGLYWYAGIDYPVLRNGGESTHGQNAGDFNHFGLQMHSTDNQLPYEVEASVIPSIL